MTTPVLLVHGFGTSFELTWVHNGWVDLLEDEGRPVIGVDLLGHGSAPKPTEPDAYADLGTRVLQALSDHAPPGTRVDAVGFSLGAKTLLQVAAAEPDRFRSLVVAGVGDGIIDQTAGGHAGRSRIVDAVRTGDDGGDPGLRYFAGLAELPGNDREALAACISNGGGGVGVDDLARIGCPVLVVLGDQDTAAPADRLVGALPDAGLEVLPRTDHAKTPKSFAFIDRTLEFLRSLDA